MVGFRVFRSLPFSRLHFGTPHALADSRINLHASPFSLLKLKAPLYANNTAYWISARYPTGKHTHMWQKARRAKVFKYFYAANSFCVRFGVGFRLLATQQSLPIPFHFI